MKIRIKIQAVLVFSALAVSILLSKFLFPIWRKEAPDEFLDALGIAVVFLGILFRIAARGNKSEISHDGKSLLTSGLYSLLRHPMYFGTLLIGFGITLALFDWWAFLLFLLAFLLIYAPQTCREEQRLQILFGKEYRDYCEITPKYFPNIFRLFNTDILSLFSFKWPWLKKELPSLISIIIVIMAIKIWEDTRLFGFVEFKKEVLELLLVIIFLILVLVLLYKKNGPRVLKDEQ